MSADPQPGGPPDASPGDPRRALGRLGEELAAAHLTRLGFAVLERNVRTPRGEIDLIAFDGETLAFVEVKTLRCRGPSAGAGAGLTPLEGLRGRQRASLRRLAAGWLCASRERPSARTIRFDAIGVLVDGRDRLLRLDHVEAAW